MEGTTPDDVRTLLRWFKDGPPGAIPIEEGGKSLGFLQAATWEDAGDGEALERLGAWHESTFSWFPEPFPVTPASVRNWLVEQVLRPVDRVLFWIKDVRGNFAGHVGLTRIDHASGQATIGDIVSSQPSQDRLVHAGIEALAAWTQDMLGMRVNVASTRHSRAA